MPDRLVVGPDGARRAQEAHVPELVEQPAGATGRAVFDRVEGAERERLSAQPSQRYRTGRSGEPRNTGRQQKRSIVHEQRVTVRDAEIVGRLVLCRANAQTVRHG